MSDGPKQRNLDYIEVSTDRGTFVFVKPVNYGVTPEGVYVVVTIESGKENVHRFPYMHIRHVKEVGEPSEKNG